MNHAPATRLLVPLAAPAAAGAAALPARIVVCPWGESRALDGGAVIVNETTAAVLAANQAKAGFGEIVLDFNHNTWGGTGEDGRPARVQEPVKVAAYGTLEVVPGEGIVFTPRNWTPEGSAHFLGGHYKDLSPTVFKNAAGEVVFVHSVSLCRQGQIEGLHAYAAGLAAVLSASEPTIQAQPHPSMDHRKILLALLGLGDDATDEAIAQAAELAAAKLKTPGAPDDDDAIPAEALAARVDTLERTILLDGAARDGKVIPLSAGALAALPLPALKEMVAHLPAGVVPQGPAGASAAAAPQPRALSAAEREVCRQLGIPEEAFRAAGGN